MSSPWVCSCSLCLCAPPDDKAPFPQPNAHNDGQFGVHPSVPVAAYVTTPCGLPEEPWTSFGQNRQPESGIPKSNPTAPYGPPPSLRSSAERPGAVVPDLGIVALGATPDGKRTRCRVACGRCRKLKIKCEDSKHGSAGENRACLRCQKAKFDCKRRRVGEMGVEECIRRYGHQATVRIPYHNSLETLQSSHPQSHYVPQNVHPVYPDQYPPIIGTPAIVSNPWHENYRLPGSQTNSFPVAYNSPSVLTQPLHEQSVPTSESNIQDGPSSAEIFESPSVSNPRAAQLLQAHSSHAQQRWTRRNPCPAPDVRLGATKEKRVSTACRICRNRQIKCDADNPCANCRNYGRNCVREAVPNSDPLRHNSQALHFLETSRTNTTPGVFDCYPATLQFPRYFPSQMPMPSQMPPPQ